MNQSVCMYKETSRGFYIVSNQHCSRDDRSYEVNNSRNLKFIQHCHHFVVPWILSSFIQLDTRHEDSMDNCMANKIKWIYAACKNKYYNYMSLNATTNPTLSILWYLWIIPDQSMNLSSQTVPWNRGSKTYTSSQKTSKKYKQNIKCRLRIVSLWMLNVSHR
jgi:hypothetical protein